MSKGLEALKEIERFITKNLINTKDNESFNLGFDIGLIEKELKALEILKEICLEGKDKYGEGTWGWVEFDLDKKQELKEWLKDD